MKSSLFIKFLTCLMFTSSIVLFAKVNLNTATKTEFQKLPGIGPKKAERIIKYRLENGKFKRIKDIVKVKGIGKKTFEKLRPLITVEFSAKEEKEVLEDLNPEGKININLADIEDFSIMPGIGSSKKKRILEYRQKHGCFKSIDEIMNVKGIGEKIFEKINVFITVQVDINKVNLKQLRKLKGIDPGFVSIINIYRNNKKHITKKSLKNILKKFPQMKPVQHFFWTDK